MNDAHLRISYYVSDQADGGPVSMDQVVFRRWLCSCGGGGYAIDAATFGREVLTHVRSRHGTNTTVVGDRRRCTAELLAFVEHQTLG